MATWVIGDVHGCLEELNELLVLISFRRGTDRLVLVGDLTDRGPDPLGVVRRAQELGAELVRSNHDEKYVRWHRHEARRAADPSYENPMEIIGTRLATAHALSAGDVAYLTSAPFIIRLSPLLVVVHGGLESDAPVSGQREAVIRVRNVDESGHMVAKTNSGPPLTFPEGSVYWTRRWRGPESVIYGHNVHGLTLPDVAECAPGVFAYGIDTGCCFGGRLTAMDADTREFVQVQARRAYSEWRVYSAHAVASKEGQR